ncbi:MAG TPA: MFS transporter [Dehalococcoidia bacterium]|jgi:MFS family permease
MSSVAVAVERPTRPPLRHTFLSLRNYNYRLFFFGQMVSLIGTWMQSTALAWLVLQQTNSPLALGTVYTAQFLPVLLLSLFGGVFADRFAKHRLVIALQSVLALQAVALALVTGFGLISLPAIYLLTAIQGTANALENPARQSFVIEMVGRDDLPNAVALNSSLVQMTRLVGPALGGLCVAWLGPADCFAINAVSFVAVLAGLLYMKPSRLRPSATPQRANVLRQVGEGLRYAVTTPDILLIVITMGLLGLFGYNFQVFLPLIADYVLRTSALGYGLLTSALAAGSLAATLAVAYAGRASRRVLLLGATSFSIVLLTVGLARWWALLVPLLLVLGFSSSVFTATTNSRIQLIVPPQLRGRTMSIYMLLFAGTTPIGSALVGAAAQRLGVQPTIALMGMLCILGVVAAHLYLRRVRGRLLPDRMVDGTLMFDDAPTAPGGQPERAPALLAERGRGSGHERRSLRLGAAQRDSAT